MIELSHRERVLRAIEHKDIDRVPLFFRAEKEITDKLKELYLLKSDMELLSYFDSDAVQINVPYKDLNLEDPDENGIWFDQYGNRMKTVVSGNTSTQTVIEPVLSGAENITDIDKVKWPDGKNVNLQEGISQAEAARSSGLAVYGGVWATIFTLPRRIMGEEHFLVSMYENPDFITKLVGRITDSFISMNEAYFKACAKYLDVFYFGSDFGTQNSLFISREHFQKFFMPYMKKLVQHAKDYGLKVMYHTCGAVTGIIPDLVACGIDVLDPVQVSAAGMQPEKLAAGFKGKIAFHGGISTQTTLPFGTPEEVRNEVVRLIDTLGPTGLIAAPDQDMIGDIPLKNMEVMFKTIREYKIV